jgi:hypothetical protein
MLLIKLQVNLREQLDLISAASKVMYVLLYRAQVLLKAEMFACGNYIFMRFTGM